MVGTVAAILPIAVIVILVLAAAYYAGKLPVSWTNAVGLPPKGTAPAAEKLSLVREIKEPMTPVMAEYDRANNAARVAEALGYSADMPWTEYLAATQVDSSMQQSHMDYVADVRRFSSGANFTSVADDNGSPFFTNFIGLRRPEHVPIGDTARNIPDVDTSVLQRNGPKGFF
jgi:hypothetical protein